MIASLKSSMWLDVSGYEVAYEICCSPPKLQKWGKNIRLGSYSTLIMTNKTQSDLLLLIT